MSRDDILDAFTALSVTLTSRGLRAELAIMGGAAMVLRYSAREATKDVDAVFLSPAPAAVREAAEEVAANRGLRRDWLNDGAKGFLEGLALGDVVFESDALTVRAIAPQQLLAMKLCAWRDDRDMSDARQLLGLIPGSRESVWSLIKPHLVRGRELSAGYALDDLWEQRDGDS